MLRISKVMTMIVTFLLLSRLGSISAQAKNLAAYYSEDRVHHFLTTLKTAQSSDIALRYYLAGVYDSLPATIQEEKLYKSYLGYDFTQKFGISPEQILLLLSSAISQRFDISPKQVLLQSSAISQKPSEQEDSL